MRKTPGQTQAMIHEQRKHEGMKSRQNVTSYKSVPERRNYVKDGIQEQAYKAYKRRRKARAKALDTARDWKTEKQDTTSSALQNTSAKEVQNIQTERKKMIEDDWQLD